jgi:hypothetical protein
VLGEPRRLASDEVERLLTLGKGLAQG